MKNKSILSSKLIVILMILIVILIIGSVVAMRILLKDVQNVNGSAGEEYTQHYAFIAPDENADMWDNIYEGALAKGEELGVYVENFGENLTVDYDQNSLLQIAIDANVDGIIIDGDTSLNNIALIEKATEAGIPVVTVLDDSPESERVCFVGISSYTMGRQYGDEIVGLVDENSDTPMHVIVLMEEEHDGSGQEIVLSGITDVFSEAGLGDRLNIEGIYIDNSSAFSAEEDIRDIFLNDELPDVLVTLNPVYTRCLFQAAVDYNRVGDVRIYGFYDSDDILDAVSKDIIDATLSVNTYDMGASAAEALKEYIDTGYVSAYITQDTELILENEAKKRLNARDEENN